VALPREYSDEICPIARSLEIVGERWTLLIVRDAFYGVRRFSDFRMHLNIPKAVLSERLSLLVREGVFAKQARGGHREYVLTAKGRQLWPAIWSLVSWGNDNYVDQAHRRSYRHADCGGRIGVDRLCGRCGQLPDVADLVLHPPRRPRDHDDPVSTALRQPHRMLEPVYPS
jgi:DNA-binding HxlR family transcriptional regulator